MKKRKRKRKGARLVLFILVLASAFFAARYLLYETYFPLEYRDIIHEYAAAYDVDEYLVMSMINSESRYRPRATSPAGARGLMQMTVPTAVWVAQSMGLEEFTAEKLYDPEINIKMGTWYVDNLSKEFDSTELILAAYNAGRGRVNEWQKTAPVVDGDKLNIPYPETKAYVQRVMLEARIYRLLYG